MKKREKTFFVCFKNWFGIVFTLIVLVSFSETTTPGSAGESKKNYIVKSPLVSWKCGRPTALTKYKGVFSDGKRYRKPATHNMEMPVSCGICTEISKNNVWETIWDLRKWKGVEIIEGNGMPDHLYILVNISPKISMSSFMDISERKVPWWFLKGMQIWNIKSGIGTFE